MSVLQRLALGALLAVVGVSLLLPISASAQQPTLTLVPNRGPCDATVNAIGADFPPGAEIELAIGRPESDTELETLTFVTADENGAFETAITFGATGCDIASGALAIGPIDHLTVFADLGGNPLDQLVFARAQYDFTTTSALPTTGSGPAEGRAPLLPLATLAIAALIGAGIAIRVRTLR